MDTHMWICGVE